MDRAQGFVRLQPFNIAFKVLVFGSQLLHLVLRRDAGVSGLENIDLYLDRQTDRYRRRAFPIITPPHSLFPDLYSLFNCRAVLANGSLGTWQLSRAGLQP